MIKKIALITGITGQDGSYLSELLIKKNYEVHGFVRTSFKIKNSRNNWKLKKNINQKNQNLKENIFLNL